MLAPRASLNASFAARTPPHGDLALISQSGAIAAGLVEWASTHQIGFSAVVSLGDEIDVDFGDLLDFFALDGGPAQSLSTSSSISNARKFMSAARAAARASSRWWSSNRAAMRKAPRRPQPIRARSPARTRSTTRRSAAPACCACSISRSCSRRPRRSDGCRPFPGKRLAILTNGGGIGVLAVDRLADLGGTLAGISPQTMQRLDAALPPIWSNANPIDIAGDADPPLRRGARGAARRSRERRRPGDERADRARLAPRQRKSLLRSPGAQHPVIRRRSRLCGLDRQQRCGRADLRSCRHPELCDRIRRGARLHASRALPRGARRPDGDAAELAAGFWPDVRLRPRPVIEARWRASAPGSIRSRPRAAWRLCHSDRAGRLARDPEEAAAVAALLLAQGSTVVAKILSPDIVHKSEVGGVRLNLTTRPRCARRSPTIWRGPVPREPDARITGVTIHPMILRPKARELIAGIADDPTFGPVIVFGRGGTAVEVIDDKALALPPLDLKLARA